MTKGGWTVKTLDSYDEIEQALRLRHAVFHEEHHGRRLASGIDVDDIDEVCDHLGILDASGTLVASYRLTSTNFSNRFYAQKRFDLARFLAMDGPKLELGRACVARTHRNGVLLHLLWRGITEYVRLSGTRYLFGSSSIRTESSAVAAHVYRWLESADCTTTKYGVEVRPECRAFSEETLAASVAEATRPELPPLFQLYLRVGAKVCAPPARDPFLGSADFFTVVDCSAIDARFERRYLR